MYYILSGYENLVFTKFNVKKRHYISKVYSNENLVYVVAGIEGIDVYEKQGLTFVLMNNILLKDPIN